MFHEVTVAMHDGVCGDVLVDLGWPEQVQDEFCMWQQEIPLVFGEGLISAGSDADEVCLDCLDCSFRRVGLMVAW